MLWTIGASLILATLEITIRILTMATKREDRQILNGGLTQKQYTSALCGGKAHYEYIHTSTDATATVVHAESVAELAGCSIKVVALGVRSTGAEAFRCEYIHAFKRAAAGDITAVGSATNVTVEDSSGSPTVTIVANTGNQTADVTITPEAAKTFVWHVSVEVIKISN